jgi:hypothetical protein
MVPAWSGSGPLPSSQKRLATARILKVAVIIYQSCGTVESL